MPPASPSSSATPLASHPIEGRAEFWRRALAVIIDAGAGVLAASRALLRTMVLWGWALALLTARWEIAVLASIAGGVMLAGCLYDRLIGTRVYRRTASPRA